MRSSAHSSRESISSPRRPTPPPGPASARGITKVRGNASRAGHAKATAGCAPHWSSAPGVPSGLATAIWPHNTTASRAGAATRPPSPPWATPSWSSPGTCSGTAGRTGTSDMSTSTGWTETGSFVITPAGWRNLASSCHLLPRCRQPPDGLLSEDLPSRTPRTRSPGGRKVALTHSTSMVRRARPTQAVGCPTTGRR
jgi:hypothetical protein